MEKPVLKLTESGESKFAHFASKQRVLEYRFDVIDWDRKDKRGKYEGVAINDIIDELKNRMTEVIGNQIDDFEFATVTDVYAVRKIEKYGRTTEELKHVGNYFSKWTDHKRIY